MIPALQIRTENRCNINEIGRISLPKDVKPSPLSLAPSVLSMREISSLKASGKNSEGSAGYAIADG
jgi:hypothetical protein